MNQKLVNVVLGVYYVDTASGEYRLLAKPSDAAAAQLLPPNRILYKGAFDSDLFKGDLVYTYVKGGFESDVVITRQPKKSPADCGLDPNTTVLQVRHQWLNAPQPHRMVLTTAGQGAGAVSDQFIDLGELCFPQGRAFLADSEVSKSSSTSTPARINAVPPSQATGVPVGKEWHAGAGVGGSSLLFESVAWRQLRWEEADGQL